MAISYVISSTLSPPPLLLFRVPPHPQPPLTQHGCVITTKKWLKLRTHLWSMGLCTYILAMITKAVYKTDILWRMYRAVYVDNVYTKIMVYACIRDANKS